MDLAYFRGRLDQMVADLGTLVGAESPSSDLAATAHCADIVDELAVEHVGSPAERVVVEGRTHLWWRSPGPTRVVLIGHFDTVWPLGTVQRWPFARSGERATGPGSFDMKAGIVQLFHAIAARGDRDGIAIVLTSDEEIGSPTSRPLIEEAVAGAGAALVLEPSAEGALKTERKGVSDYRLDVTGRAAHAGLDPEKGINATVELAHQVIAIAALGDASAGTTVTPTMAAAGSSSNSVPASASVHIDVRVPDLAEEARVDTALRALAPVLDDVALELERMGHVPPMSRQISAALYATAQGLAAELGLPPLSEASVGGGSDGNFTASLGIPTLDGLGAVGGNAHAEGEYVVVDAMPERAALVAALVEHLLSQ
ncbi:MAG: M20 family metallopeptidase [Actinomycetota bacterium]